VDLGACVDLKAVRAVSAKPRSSEQRVAIASAFVAFHIRRIASASPDAQAPMVD